MNHRILPFILLCLTGCGGGDPSGGGGPPTPVTVVIPTMTADDGSIRSTGFVQTNFGLFVGDLDGITFGTSSRALLRFDLGGAGIPPGATIQTATLALQQGGSAGNPYADLGEVLVDHVDVGPAIDVSDYSGNSLHSAWGTLSTDPAIAVKTLEVGARVQADLTAGRTVTGFRLRFVIDFDGDAVSDYTQFNDAENTSGIGPKPALTVTYLP